MGALSHAYHGPLPSGTVTFAFTDVEGSARRWDHDRAAMDDATRRHDAHLYVAIGRHRGHVFKTVGEAFCAAFERPEDAIAAMMDAQVLLAAEDFTAVDGLPVRMAIHTGTADERDGDYYGPALNRVARLLSIGHGDQVLISGVTADLVRDALPLGAGLRDLGDHRLRDLARPEHVFQLTAPALRTEFPPLRSLSVLPNNLPRSLNAFFGREREIEEITTLVRGNPLVTLVGSGGIGKTRTSLQVAANLHDGWTDGVWLIELAPITSGDAIPAAVARARELALPADGDPLAHLVHALKPKHLLLLFDNCEHLIEPASHVIAALLRECAHLTIIASSRQALGLSGEVTYRVPLLGLPSAAASATITAANALTFPAVALFVERSHSADQRFTLTDENAPIIADICRRLDGIALAIELAAARVKVLSPLQLRERLNERFRVLTGGGRDLSPRQQTLRALIDWSHELLDARERMLFRRLGLFAGTFTIEAATTVVTGDDLDELDVFEVLESLVDKSLVLAEADGDAEQYRLLESTRAFALEQLDAANERADLAPRHVRYVGARFAELAATCAQSGRETDRTTAFLHAIDDVRAALSWAIVHGPLDAGAQLLVDLGSVWLAAGLEATGIPFHDAALAALPARPSPVRARVWITLATLLDDQGAREAARAAAQRALSDARALDDAATLALALDALAWQAARAHRSSEAEALIDEAAPLTGASPLQRFAQVETRALLCATRGDVEGAISLLGDLRREHTGLGNTDRVHRATRALAVIEHANGATRRAIGIVRELLPALRRTPNTSLLVQTLGTLATALLDVDDFLGATEVAREALLLMGTTQPDHIGVVVAIEVMAYVHAVLGNDDRAATLAGYAWAARRRLGCVRELNEQRAHERLGAALQAHLDPAARERLIAAGDALATDAAIAFALEA
jgi:predicted ATPase/class 3 adenylate cyclase